MCVTSLLCGPRADLWPFYGTRFIKGAKLFERMLIIDLFTVYDAILAVGKHGQNYSECMRFWSTWNRYKRCNEEADFQHLPLL